MSKSKSETTISPTIIDLDAETIVEANDHRPQEEPQSAPSPAKKSNRNWFILALVGGLLGGGLLYRSLLAEYFPSSAMTDLTIRFATLEAQNKTAIAQLQGLDTTITSMKTDLRTAGEQASAANQKVATIDETVKIFAPTLSQLESDLAALKQSVAAVPTTTGTPPANPALIVAITARLEALEKDLASLKQAPPGKFADTAALSQAMAEIKAKVASGVGYRAELERVARMVPAADGLDILNQYAETGLPNALGLAAELDALKPALPKTEEPSVVGESDSYFDQFLNAISGLITIRSLEAEDWSALAEKSVAYATAGDLDQAIKTLDAVETVLPDGLEQWRNRARNRQALEIAMNKTAEAVLREIAAKG